MNDQTLSETMTSFGDSTLDLIQGLDEEVRSLQDLVQEGIASINLGAFDQWIEKAQSLLDESYLKGKPTDMENPLR